MENRFYKVQQSGFGVVSATFFNPVTREEHTKIVWDIENDRLLFDEKIQTLRNLPMAPDDIVRAWKHSHGTICSGDKIMVVKGRKVPVGTVARVEKVKEFYDRYGRWCCDYAYLDNGKKTNIDNCILVLDT